MCRSHVLAAVLLVAACAESHVRTTVGSGPDASDGATLDAAILEEVDAGTEPERPAPDMPVPGDGPDGVTCGPNRCRTMEVCCDDRCGICAYEGECPDFECPDPARP